MACANCGFENREGTRFCVECGEPLSGECPSCQAPVEATQRFCGECGTALSGPPLAAPPPLPDAVRKTVTVLFADLGGSTGFGERTDAEISRRVLADYHALLQETIDAHTGTVAKFMGDGMMATFGIPEVAEDDAERAVRAGVALQVGIEAFAADVERRHGETLTLRVGINTGEVVIGDADADVIGDALNVAARLEKACRPGHVLVGEETWRLTRGDIAYEALGEVSVAGRAQPVAIYEVAVAASAPDAEVVAPFVGRDAEMERLVSVFDDARTASAARLVTVLGSPGVGKTRLSRELARQVAKEGDAVTLETRCVRSGEATFAPVAQLIRDALDIGDDADADSTRIAIAALLPGADGDDARVADVLASLVGAAPTRSVEETFWAIRRLVEAVAARRPMVIVIDDVQWAEPLLLDLLEHLAEWVSGAPVLLVALARPELREVRPALAEPGRPVAAVVVLDGLDARATEALAAGLLGADRLPAGLVERLPSSTDGNPLFVRELVRMLVDDQVIRDRGDGEWELTIDVEAVDVPPTIQSLLGARVERLPSAERQLLELASVVGAEFSLGALRELAGDQTPVGPLLDSMRRKELVEPTGTYWGDEPVHRFHHVLIREAAYRRLLKSTRAELHERVAEWTDQAAAGVLGEHEAAIAHHFEQAHRYRTELGTLDVHTATLGRRAAALLTTAAQRALGGDDLASAAALSSRALPLLPEGDRTARADLLMLACECLLASGNAASAREVVEELGTIAGDDTRLAAWADCFSAQLVSLTDPEGLLAADAEVQAAAAAFAALEDGSGQAKAHQVRAGILARLGRVGDAESELDLALAAARLADDRRRVTAVLGAAPDAALFGPSPVARAGGRCLDVVRLLRITSASPSVEAASNRCQAVLEALRGRFDVARSMLATARAAVEELGLRHGLAQTDLYAGMVELIAGDPRAAIPSLRVAFEDLGALGVGADAGNAAALLAGALLVDGAVDEADQMASASERLAGQNLKTAVGWRVARAEVMAAQGEIAGAVALAEEAVQIAAGTDLIVDHADACAALAQLRAQAGDALGAASARADAARLYDQKGATVLSARLTDEPVTSADTSEGAPAPAEWEVGEGAEPRREGVDPRSPRAENLASRAWSQVFTLSRSGDPAELAGLFAEDYRFVDQRPIVGLGEHDRTGAAGVLTATSGEWDVHSPPSALAVRGERLALSRGNTFTDGSESPFLSVAEVDGDGTMAACTLYGEDQLAQAIAELDARYLAGEGAEHPQAAATISTWAAAGAGEWDGYLEWCAPDFRLIDHRSLAWPELDREGFVDLLRATAEAVPDMVQVLRKVFVGPGVNLTVSDASGTADGGHFEWVAYGVNQVDEQGRLHRLELFDERDWEAALTRFDELSGAAAAEPPELENAAMATVRIMHRLLDDGRLDELRGHLHDDLAVRSERWHGRPPQTADEYVDSLRILREQYDPLRMEPIAVRGDRLSVHREQLTDEHSNELVVAVAVEVDAVGRVIQLVNFDGDDVGGAVIRLDEWFIEREGAEHAELLRAWQRILELERARDWDGMREELAGDYVYADHRRLGFTAAGREEYLALRRSGDADIVRGTDLFLRLLPAGRAVLFTRAKAGLDGAGSEHEWVMHGITAFDSSWRVERNDLFDAGDWAGALACFNELSGKAARASDGGGGLRVENAATRLNDRIFALTEQGRMDDAYVLIADGYERIDRRRSVAAPATRGQEELQAALEATLDVGFTSFRITPVAIRGDRLALSRAVLTTPDGLQMQFLEVDEVDEHGQSIRSVYFDDDDVSSAQRELDERYITGEGAADAELIRAAARVDRAFARAPDAVAAMCAPDFAFDDHRRVFYGQGGSDELVAIRQASPDAHVDRTVTVNRTVLVEGRALLTAQDLHRVDPDGSEYRWRYTILVAFDDEMLLRRLEWFDEDDWDAALARLHELATDPATDERSARVENTATRLMDRFPELARARRFDEMADLVAEDYVRVDHRGGLPAPTSHGPADFVELIKATVEVGFDEIRNTPLAVRGERLALSRVDVRAADGRELVFLQVHEWDEGQLAHASHYDEEDLPAAIMAMDARYAELRGSDYTAGERNLAASFAAWYRGDWEDFASLFEPDFTRDDRTPLGMGVQDRASYLQSLRELSELAPGVIPYAAKYYVAPGTLVIVLPSRPYDVDGSAFAWEIIYVLREGPSGGAAQLVTYAAADWADALALFDEWSAESATPTPALENTATRALERLAAEIGARDVDRLGPLYTDDTVVDDRRRGVSSGVSTGRQATLDLVRGFFEVGIVEFSHEVLAVRGNELALVARRFASADGFQMSLLAVVEVDGEGRFSLNVLFDDGDLVGALEALEQRHLERHGSTMLLSERRHLDDTLRVNRGEVDLSRLAPGYRLVDHSYAGFGDSDGAGFQAQLDVMRSQVSSLTIVPGKLHASDRAVLSRYSIIGVDQDGADCRWEMANVQGYDEIGQITESHSFQIEQWTDAVALFDELSSGAAPTGPPALENAVARSMERMREVFAARDWEAVADQYPEDTACDDRRSGVSSGITTGREGLVALVRGLADVGFVSFDSETLAIRGDRLALMLRRWQRQDGFELPVLAVQDVDDLGRQAWIALFDADDLVGAIDALEDRHAALCGEAYSEIERRDVDAVHRINHGDYRAALVGLAPDYLTIDHSPLGFGTLDAVATGEQVELMASSVETIVQLSRQRLVAPRAILSLLTMRGTTADGGDILWDYVLVRCHDADGLVTRGHVFQAEQWDEALALFEEWSAAPDRDDGAALQNAATRHSESFRDVLASEGISAVSALLRPDLSYLDHRWGGIAPSGTEADDFLAHVRSARSAGFTTVEFRTLAIRGDRLSFDRWKTVTDAGDLVEHVSVKEVDEAGLGSRTELFDLADLPQAVALLDEWYLEGEGAEHVAAIGPKAEFTRCLNGRDWDGVRRLLPPQVDTVDHRLASTGTTLETPELAIAHMRELIELVPDFTSFDAEYVAIGRQCTLTRQIAVGRSTQGAEVEFATLLLSQLVEGRFTRTEIFPAEQLAEARARFVELEGRDGSAMT